jgi:hypothetical protein
MMGDRKARLLHRLINNQMQRSIMACMPLGDWKQLAKERSQWIKGRRTQEVPWMDLETADEEPNEWE